jgi:FAD/FMN-containing dehydrogenase
MNRRRLLRTAAAAVPLLPSRASWLLAPPRAAAASRPMSRVRPGDPAWPPEASWDRLGRGVGGRLVKVRSPLAACLGAPSAPAQRFWDPGFLAQVPGLVFADDRPGAPAGNVFWASNREEAGQVLHGYRSLWLPASLLGNGRREALADALFAASQHWAVTLHINKGLAGAPAEAIEAARDTATNPAVLDAFALLISAAEGPPAYPGLPGHEPDLRAARRHKAAIDAAMEEIQKLLPSRGSYVAEGDFFAETWREAFWGPNYARLLAVKDKHDPDGLFFVHHGVGSEYWSADGFTRWI